MQSDWKEMSASLPLKGENMGWARTHLNKCIRLMFSSKETLIRTLTSGAKGGFYQSLSGGMQQIPNDLPIVLD